MTNPANGETQMQPPSPTAFRKDDDDDDDVNYDEGDNSGLCFDKVVVDGFLSSRGRYSGNSTRLSFQQGC